jgi:hypothetical protein
MSLSLSNGQLDEAEQAARDLLVRYPAVRVSVR